MRLLPLGWRRNVQVGRGVSVTGRIWTHGGGYIRIGDRVRLDAHAAPIELHAEPGAEIVVGADAVIDGGVSIEAQQSVSIGERCRIAAFAKIMDNHFHSLRGDRRRAPPSDAVVVGDGSEIGRRAILLPGARLRSGTVVPPGAIVRGPPPAARAVGSGRPE